MKHRMIYVVVLFLTLGLTACAEKSETVQVKVTESSWSGWERDYVPNETETIFDVAKGDTISLEQSGDIVLTVIKCSSQSLQIETNNPLSDKDSGIDLTTDKTKFKVNAGKPLTLMTPTMDAGNIIIIEIVE